MPITQQELDEVLTLSEEFPTDPELAQIAVEVADQYERESIERKNVTRNLFQDRVKHGLPDETLSEISKLYPTDSGAKYRLFNDRFLKEFAGVDDASLEANRSALRRAYASQVWGEPIEDEGQFFERVAADFDMEDEIGKRAVAAGLEGVRNLDGLSKIKEEFAGNQSFTGREKDWQDIYLSAVAATRAKVAPYTGTINAITRDLMEKTGVTETGEDAGSYRELARDLLEVPKEDRPLVLSAILARGTTGEDGLDKGMAKKLAENFGRGLLDYSENIPANLERSQVLQARQRIESGLLVDAGSLTPDGILGAALSSLGQVSDGATAAIVPQNPVDVPEELKAEALALTDQLIEGIDLRAQLRNIAETGIDPATSSFQPARGLYSAARSLPYTLTSLAPGGFLLNSVAMSETSYQALREANPDMTAGQAQAISMVAGPAMAGLERISGKLLTGNLKALNRFYNQISITGRAAAGRFATRTAGTILAEQAQENAQDLTPFLVQGAMSALSEDVPSVDWQGRFGEMAANQSEIFWAVLPLALIGGGAGTVNDIRGARELLGNYDMLRATGLSEAAASEVRAKATAGDLQGAQAMLRSEFRQSGADQKTVQEAQAEAIPKIQAEAANLRDLIAKGQDLDLIPTIVREMSGAWSLQFQDGTKTEFETYAEAGDRMTQHIQDSVLNLHTDTANAIRTVSAGIDKGRGLRYLFSTEAPVVADAEAAGTITPEQGTEALNIAEQLSPEIQTEFDQATTAAGIVSKSIEERKATARILGSSANEMRDGIVVTTMRLYSGATTATVLEEKFEGDAKFMIGQLGLRKWMTSALRDWERVTGDKLLFSDDETVTNRNLVEAWSKMGVSYFAATGDGSTGFSMDKARKLLDTSLAGPLTGYSALFQGILKRAAMIDRAKAEGTFDGDLEEFLGRATGMSEQTQFERAVVKEGGEIASNLTEAGSKLEEITNEEAHAIADDIGGLSHLTGLIYESVKNYAAGDPMAREKLEVSLDGAFGKPDGGEGDYPGDAAFSQFVDEMEAQIQASIRNRQITFSVIADAGRSRPRQMIQFPNGGITGPSGARLVAYEWQFKLEEQPNREGELVGKRVSDWNKAVTNDLTGRDIVHQFIVEKPDGSTSRISLESAAKELGFASASESGAKPVKDVAAAVKSLAKLRMKLAAQEAENEERIRYRKAYDQEMWNQRELARSEKWEVRPKESAFPGTPAYAFSVGGVDVVNRYGKEVEALVESGAWERQAQWRDQDKDIYAREKTVDAIGPATFSNSVESDLKTTRRAIRKAEEKIGKVIEETTFSIIPTDGNLDDTFARMFSPFQRSPELRMTLGQEMKRRVEEVRKGAAPFIVAQMRTKASIEREAKTIEAFEYDRLLRETFGADTQMKQDALPPVDTQAARSEARAFADKWKAQKLKEKEAAPRQNLLGFLRTLDAITRALPAEVRGKIGGYVTLAKLTTPGAMLGEIERRVAKVDSELESWMRKEADDRRKKLFKTAQPKRESGKKPKGKAGADIHDLFDRLKESLIWDGDKAEAWAAMLEEKIAKGELSADQEAHAKIEANLVRLFSDWKNADSARRTAAVEAGEIIWQEGYMAEKKRIAEERERREAARQEIRQGTGKLGNRSEREKQAQKDAGLSGRWKERFLSLFNFEQVARFAMGNESKWATWFADSQREAENKKTDEVQSVLDGLDDLFRELAGSRLGAEKLQWRLSQKSFTTAQGGDMSELEGITALLMWRQEDGRRHMKGKRDEDGKLVSSWSYDESFIEEIERNLSDEGRAVMDYLIEQYAGEYETLNPVFRELNGINLPRNDKYSPLTVKPQQAPGGQQTDPVTGSTMSNGSMTPGSLRTRAMVVAEPDFRNAVETFVAHKKQLAHWKAYAVFNRDAAGILGNREVGNSIEAAGGKEAVSVLRSWLDYFAQGGARDAAAHLEISKGLGRVVGRAAAMQLVGRVGTIAIQVTQLAAAAAKMPLSAYTVRLSRLLTGNLGWGAALSSPYIQRRLATMPPSVQVAMEGLRGDRPNVIKHAARRAGELIGGMDALMTAGTYAIVRDYRASQYQKSGIDPQAADELARQDAERIVDEIAQPTRSGARSLFELTSTSAIGRISWAFASEARKNLAFLAYSYMKRSKLEAARGAFAVIVLQGVMAGIIRTAWKDLRDDDEDEDEWSARRIVLSAGTEWLYGFPVLGDVSQGVISAAAGEWQPGGTIMDSAGRAPAAIGRIPENFDDILSGDFEQPLRDLETLLMAGGLANDTVAGLASFSHVLRDAAGVVRNLVD